MMEYDGFSIPGRFEAYPVGECRVCFPERYGLDLNLLACWFNCFDHHVTIFKGEAYEKH